MATPTKNTKPAFASAAQVSTADELFERLIALRPMGTVTLETSVGVSDATECQVIEVTQDGAAVDLGVRSIFWTYIRRQLGRATPDVPWIAGTLTKSGQAYTLAPLTNAEAHRVQSALASLEN